MTENRDETNGSVNPDSQGSSTLLVPGEIFGNHLYSHFDHRELRIDDGLDGHYPDADKRDLIAMEAYSEGWDYDDFTNWVRRGFDVFRAHPGSGIRAFAPVSLLPGGDLIDQLSWAFRVAKNLDLGWPTKLLNSFRALFEHKFESISDEDLLFYKDFWELMSKCDPPCVLGNTARSFLETCREVEISPSTRGELTNAIAETVFACQPFTGSQVSFFEWLERQEWSQGKPMWQQRYFSFLIECWLGEQKAYQDTDFPKGARLEFWLVFSTRHYQDLTELLATENSLSKNIVSNIEGVIGFAVELGASFADRLRRLILSESATVDDLLEHEKRLVTFTDGSSCSVFRKAVQ